VWAVVPLKGFSHAKQRLSAMLDPTERAGLMLAMARDVISTLTACRHIAGTVVVSRADDACALAAELGAEVLHESAQADLSGAVHEGCSYVERHRGATSAFVVHGDVPLIECADIEDVLDAHDVLTLVPDSDNDGTNCIVVTPPTGFPFHFGRASFERHRRAAREHGIAARLAANVRLGLDIDTPDDLRALIERNGARHTRTYLDRSGIASRVGGPHNSPPTRARN
jgi:2-phospho-L-lactate guanylyltransferase